MKHMAGVLERATRLLNNEGNPKWRLTVAGAGTFETAPKAQCAFAVSKEHIGEAVEITVDPFGRVFQYAPLPGRRYRRG